MLITTKVDVECQAESLESLRQAKNAQSHKDTDIQDTGACSPSGTQASNRESFESTAPTITHLTTSQTEALHFQSLLKRGPREIAAYLPKIRRPVFHQRDRFSFFLCGGCDNELISARGDVIGENRITGVRPK
jgi:hypothetical protein